MCGYTCNLEVLIQLGGLGVQHSMSFNVVPSPLNRYLSLRYDS